ncbi:unnamed protein product [Adineta steineri]|uniref:NAD(P)(+)--arginine ADP-ribosyltransferase n=1 Tax=Adineta steineri TaxID=433720 RepID=A0A813N187_9BILA|nr:unnamed protein product [Adineta steineri]CAF0759544.1 unnamed protein product [Adineta steineri]CAF3867896.1 unnamed protein product [Adineta steineri]CAF4038515.1 unnamed protein product [Adineta steineri]
MSGFKSNENAVVSSKSTTSRNIQQSRQRMTQNYLLLWVDTSIDPINEDYENPLKQIRTITGDINAFTQRDACIDFLTDPRKDIKFFLIVKDTMFQQIMPHIHDIPQLDSVYILNDIKILYEEWPKKYDKIKSIDNNIDDLCQASQIGIKQFNQDSIAMSFITVDEMASTDNLNQLEPTFMYTQLFKEILLDMDHGEQAIKQFTTYCRNCNSVSPINIDRFEKEYSSQLAIWWYTFPSDIYSMLNYGLRTMDADIIITMGFFLRDVHQQIKQLYEQQVNSYEKKPFLVYRGQGLMKSDFKKLQKTKCGLMSFNNFLSTSKDKDVSLGFAQGASTKLDTMGILFIMSIDPYIKSIPFAFIKEMSYFQEEEEILFSMHTVFRVSAITQIDNNNQLYQVELQLTSDEDPQLRLLTDRIREEAGGGTGWDRLSELLFNIGQFNKAEHLYTTLLEQTSDISEQAHYYNRLGGIYLNQGDYEKAIRYCEKALEIRKKTLSANHPDLAFSYNNIGSVCDEMGEYSQALLAHEKALEIREKTLPSNHPDLATSYNNIGLVYMNMGEYSKALSFYEKALEIDQKSLPPNHPSLATSYCNISSVYDKMGDYSQALSYHEKALEIDQKNLPSNHPSLATSYNNIGLVYEHTGEYSQALSYHEKALEIREKTLPANHPHLASVYNNIGRVYDNIGEYSKALSYHEKALEIKQKTLPSNHPSLATSYSNIGSVYDKMGEYPQALSSHEKALEIDQKTLSPNHPHLATSYNNIGLVYEHTGEYSQSLASHRKALEIREKSLPSNHPSLATSYNNIGSVYNNMGEYSKALSYHEKALEIREKSLPSNHPSLATSYSNIGSVYKHKEEYSQALSYHEKALKIREKTLSLNHPDLANSYNYCADLYYSMKDYSKALSYFERTLDIYQRALYATHPDIIDVKKSIEFVKKETIKNS